MATVQAGILFLVLYISVSSASQSGVPVLLWTNTGSQLPEPLVGHSTSAEDFTTNYLQEIINHKKHNTVVFLNDKLNLDDITKHADVYNEKGDGSALSNIKNLMESHTSMHLPSVKDAARSLQALAKGFTGKVHQLTAPYSAKDLNLGKEGNNLVMVKLPESKGSIHDSLKKADGIINSVTSHIKSLGLPFTALFTGQSASQGSGFAGSQKLGRHLLAAGDNTTFVNQTNCMLYVEEITLTLTRYLGKPVKGTFILGQGTVGAETSCKADSNMKIALEFKDVKYETTTLDTVKVVFDVGNTTSVYYWYVANLTLTYSGTNGSLPMSDNNVPMITKDMYAPQTFSYHCSNVMTRQVNSSGDNFGFLTFKQLQVQIAPFKQSSKFGYPNDCTSFFSIPILSGLIVSVFFISILSMGIMMIASIKTMDRFDDPKGKSITVNVRE